MDSEDVKRCSECKQKLFDKNKKDKEYGYTQWELAGYTTYLCHSCLEYRLYNAQFL